MADCPSVPYWQPALGRLGQCVTGIEEISQAIQIIVNTPLGSVPMRPEFGCDLLPYLDQPLNTVRAPLIREITQAIQTWEPRVKVQQISVTREELGHLVLHVSWKLKDDTALQTTVVSTAQDNTPTLDPPNATLTLDAIYAPAGERGHVAFVADQPGAEYFWTVTNGVVVSGQGSAAILFAVGEAEGQSTTTVKVLVQRGNALASSHGEVKILPYPELQSWTTSSLVPKDSQPREIPVGARYCVTRIQTSSPARVRLYKTAAQRLADLDRSPDIDPIGDHGLLFEALTTEDRLDIPFHPWAFATATEAITYAQVDNAGKGAGPITVTLATLRLEP